MVIPNWCSSSRSPGRGRKLQASLFDAVLLQLAGDGKQRRGLEVVSVKSAEGPIQARNGHRHAKARTDGVLSQAAAEVCGTRIPTLSVSHEKGLNLSSMKKAARPPVP